MKAVNAMCACLKLCLLTRDVLPSQGGRYTGFGNAPQPDANRNEDSHEFLTNTWSSLATVSTDQLWLSAFCMNKLVLKKGWSHFTSGASALASQAGEKAVQLGSAFDSSVLKPSAQQVGLFSLMF